MAGCESGPPPPFSIFVKVNNGNCAEEERLSVVIIAFFFFLLGPFSTYTVTVRCCNRLGREEGRERRGGGGHWLFVSTHAQKSFVSSERGQSAVARGCLCFGYRRPKESSSSLTTPARWSSPRRRATIKFSLGERRRPSLSSGR